MAKWTTEQRREALKLAEATTIQEAASKTDIPAGTIKRWRSEERRRSKQKTKSNEPNHKSEPPNRTERTEPINSHAGQISNEPASFDGQCAATALSGERCKLKAMPGSEYCRRHANAVENQCTAISKQTGQQCRNKAMPGKTKCKFHGGASTGPPPGSQNNLKHGFFAKIFPDDDETRALVEEIMEKSPLDILWENIMIQYLAIARAQKIAWVQHQDDMTKVLKRTRDSENMSEEEWEIQHAWDKHHAFLAAQSKAMGTLERLIGRYEEMIQKGLGSEEHQLKLDKLRADIAKITGGDEATEDDGFIKALNSEASEVWSDEED